MYGLYGLEHHTVEIQCTVQGFGEQHGAVWNIVHGGAVTRQIFTFYGFLPASATKHLRLPNTNHPDRVRTPKFYISGRK